MNQKEINKIVKNLQNYLSENLLSKDESSIHHGSAHHVALLNNAKSKELLLDEDFVVSHAFIHETPFKTELASVQSKMEMLFLDTESTFQERLFEIIRERKIDEVELYTKAQITRQTFSKIRSNKNYTPNKNTAFLLVLALNLNLNEAENLLSRAGIAFSPSDKFDLAIKFFIENKIYNIFEINEILLQSGIKTLAG